MRLCFLPLAALVLLCAQGAGLRAAESGSTGGTLGKAGKSVSGGGAAPAEKPAVRSAPAGYPLNGTWHVRQKCNTGDFEIVLTLKHSSPAAFAGSSKGLTTGAASSVIDGQLSGRSLSFRRAGGLTGDSWTGTLSGSGRSFSGSTKGALWQCAYTASKR